MIASAKRARSPRRWLARCAHAARIMAIPRARQGFTLLELMLVLGLIVAIGGLSWPALRGPLANQRLHAAAKQVRVELARARLAAIESGEPQRFQFVPTGNAYRVGVDRVLLAPADGSQGADDNGPRLTAGGSESAPTALAPEAVEPQRWSEFELPAGVKFSELLVEQIVAPTSQPLAPASAEEELDPAVSGQTWSPPIVFHPDGTTQNAELSLQNERGMRIAVRLRGLTGGAVLGPLELVEDDPLAPMQPAPDEAAAEPAP